MEDLQLSNELERFFNAVRRLPEAIGQDVDVIEESVKEKFDAKRIIRENPLTAVGVAGALGLLASGVFKLSTPASRSFISRVTSHPAFNTVVTVAVTSILKVITDKVEDMTSGQRSQPNGADYSSSLKH